MSPVHLQLQLKSTEITKNRTEYHKTSLERIFKINQLNRIS